MRSWSKTTISRWRDRFGPRWPPVRARSGHMVKVEVEVDTLDQLRAALEEPIDAVLLDNMTPEMLTEAVGIVGGCVLPKPAAALRATRSSTSPAAASTSSASAG